MNAPPTSQLGLVKRALSDGTWHTLADIQQLVQEVGGRFYGEGSISARIRDLRKLEYGAHEVDRRPRDDGLFEYRLQTGEYDGMKAHPAAEIYPLMPDPEFKELVAKVKEHGLLETIVLLDGMVLDGRHRWRACQEAKVQPHTVEWDGSCGHPVEFVRVKNGNRRHLTPSQKATAAVEGEELMARVKEAARKRQAHGKTAPGKTLTEEIPEASEGESRAKVAKKFGTNPRYVSDAEKLKKVAPDLFQQVKEGDLKIPAAMKELKERSRTAPAALPPATRKERERWSRGYGALLEACRYAPKLNVPATSVPELKQITKDLTEAVKNLNKLRRSVKEMLR